ncbi:MAG TPA: hypothetical protein VFM68_02290 [Candidatus Saccharimonadales bacterium]|nr:hypothetical protein [Candidatus Saccharimonadales bacterium]
MTEYSPFFEEQSSQPMPDERVDILHDPSWIDFCVAATEAEDAMVIYEPNDEAAYELVASHGTDLNEKFGYEYNGQRSQVLGLAHFALGDGTIDSNLTVLDTDSASFHGTDLHYIDGKWQAVLEFYVSEHSDDLSHGFYYVPPNQYHLMDLKICPRDEEDVAINVTDLLYSQVDAARSQVTSRDFKIASPQEQRMVLECITENADSELPHECRDQSIIVNCTQYYTAYDNMPGFDLHDFYTDLTDIPAEEQSALTGIIDGFAYPELDTLPPDQLLTADNLTFNDGAHCLVLRNDQTGQTHYILPQTIVDII